MRAHQAALCGLAVPIFLTVAVWAAVNVMIAFRTDPRAFADADEFFAQMSTLFVIPAQ